MRRILAADSKRTFQIPASRSQNMRGRILRAADFLFLITKPGAEATDFSAHISQFSFLSSNSQPGLEFGRPDISHFSILNANPRTPTAWRSHNSSFRFHGSQFWFQKGPCRSQTRRLLVSHFAFLVSKGGLRSWDLRRAHFSIPISQFSLHRLQRIERR